MEHRMRGTRGSAEAHQQGQTLPSGCSGPKLWLANTGPRHAAPQGVGGTHRRMCIASNRIQQVCSRLCLPLQQAAAGHATCGPTCHSSHTLLQPRLASTLLLQLVAAVPAAPLPYTYKHSMLHCRSTHMLGLHHPWNRLACRWQARHLLLTACCPRCACCCCQQQCTGGGTPAVVSPSQSAAMVPPSNIAAASTFRLGGLLRVTNQQPSMASLCSHVWHPCPYQLQPFVHRDSFHSIP
jgi:hypothetical protein